MKQKILRTIKEYNLLEKDMHIVVGLSGGPDSVCLFDVLCKLTGEMKWTLHAVHVNHKFRPGDAEKDQLYAENLCQSRGVECFTIVRDCNELAESLGKTSEEAGRMARYEAFSQCAQKLVDAGIDKGHIAIAVAHNADDNAETLLFRIMRGTGIDGLAGIPYERDTEDGFRIVRPLLDVKRSEIEKYCVDNNLNPCIDKTNAQNLYTRNKIRNLLIPYIEENFNENIIDTVNRMSKAAAFDKDYLWRQAQSCYEAVVLAENGEEVKLNTEAMEELHRSIRVRIYAKALKSIGMTENLTSAHLDAVDELLCSQSPSSFCNLADGFKAFRQYDKLVFSCSMTGSEDGEVSIIVMSPSEYAEYKKQGTVHGTFSGIDPSKLKVRTRRDGDKIKLKMGTKKLQDFLVDEKVPKLHRDNIKVLAFGSEILWILPSEHFEKLSLKEKGRFSIDFKADASRKDDIIVLEYKTKIC